MADGTIYLGTEGMVALDASGQTLWRVLGDAGVYALFVGADGTIYAVSGDELAPRTGVVTAVLPSGTTAWTFTPSCGIVTDVAPGASGNVYVLVDADPTTPSSCTGPKGITCLRSDGSVAWSWSVPGPAAVGGSPAVGPDGTLNVTVNDFAVSQASTLVALSPQGQCPPPSPQAPQGVCAGAVVALDLTTGMPLWSAGTGATVALMTGASALYAIEMSTSGSPRSELVAIGE